MVPSPEPPRAAQDPSAEERRPTAVLLVYTWDLLRAILALFGALAAFGGAEEVRGRQVGAPVAVQILDALASAAFAAALILVGTLLTRQQRWVRRAQITLLALAIALAVGSYAIDVATNVTAFDAARLLGLVLVSLIDALAITAMTSTAVVRWYRDPGPVPFWMGSLVAFWSATAAALVVLRVVS